MALVESVDFADFANLDENNTLANLVRFRALVMRLAAAEELQPFLEPIVNSPIFETDRDSFYSGELYQRIGPQIRRLKVLLQMLPDVLRVHANPPDELTVSIKLPEPPDLRTALADLELFQKALEQLVVNAQIGGEVRLSSWEKGSFWIDLYLGAALAVGVVGSVAWAAAVVRKKELEGDLIAKKVEGLDIENAALNALRAGLEKQVRTVTDAEARAILDRYYGGGDQPEQIERIKFSIRTFAELIHKGAEVHPALYAPEEVKNLQIQLNSP